MNIISVQNLIFRFKADNRYSSLSNFENRRGYRVIGGDKGDLRFDGFDSDEDGTELVGVRVVTALDVTEEEATDIAYGIVEEAFASVGAECVEHS